MLAWVRIGEAAGSGAHWGKLVIPARAIKVGREVKLPIGQRMVKVKALLGTGFLLPLALQVVRHVGMTVAAGLEAVVAVARQTGASLAAGLP